MLESEPTPPQATGSTASAERFAAHAARLMADSRCENLLVLDVCGISQITDYLVIATGTSDRQIRSIADDLKLLAADEGQTTVRFHGADAGQWVVADFVDVVVHLFDATTRAYYDLESLWADGRRVDWQAMTTPGQFAKLRAGREAS